MPRFTVDDLDKALLQLSEVTGRAYERRPVGGGYWSAGYRVGQDYREVTSRKLADLLPFLDAYRRGYGACVDDQRERKR